MVKMPTRRKEGKTNMTPKYCKKCGSFLWHNPNFGWWCPNCKELRNP